MKQYLFDPDFLAEETAKKKRSYEKNKRSDMDFESFACYAIAQNIKNKPVRYRAYGMYWWALKQVLIENGHDFGIIDFGKDNDGIMSELYRGSNNEETIVAADAFWREMLRTTIQGNNQYLLDNQTGEVYILADAEMEGLILAS